MVCTAKILIQSKSFEVSSYKSSLLGDLLNSKLASVLTITIDVEKTTNNLNKGIHKLNIGGRFLNKGIPVTRNTGPVIFGSPMLSSAFWVKLCISI